MNYRILNISSFIWFASVLLFMGVMAIATRFMTNDPSFSQGGGEEYLLIPLLVLVSVGLISFIIIIFSLITLRIKNRNINSKDLASLGINAKYFLFGGFLLIYSSLIFLFGWRQGNLIQTASGAYSGQELFDEINNFRVENGKTTVNLDVNLCDNLVSRYQVISQGKGSHEGFENWAEKEGLTDKYSLAEMYIVDSETPRQAIESWNDSPGHRLVLLGDYKYGCSYASNGNAVIIFGNKVD